MHDPPILSAASVSPSALRTQDLSRTEDKRYFFHCHFPTLLGSCAASRGCRDARVVAFSATAHEREERIAGARPVVECDESMRAIIRRCVRVVLARCAINLFNCARKRVAEILRMLTTLGDGYVVNE
jgi:hypothetical protein